MQVKFQAEEWVADKQNLNQKIPTILNTLILFIYLKQRTNEILVGSLLENRRETVSLVSDACALKTKTIY